MIVVYTTWEPSSHIAQYIYLWTNGRNEMLPQYITDGVAAVEYDALEVVTPLLEIDSEHSDNGL